MRPPAASLDQPSDDPRTPIPDDPTRDVVGSTPLLFAPKSAALLVDAGSPGIVDPGDVLHYTISVHNSGAVPATDATLSDSVPANTTYVADSLTLNGLPVGQPDAGVSPLVAGIPDQLERSHATAARRPVCGHAESGRERDDRVRPAGRTRACPAGRSSATRPDRDAAPQLLDLLTDGDGNPSTGPEPTVVVVGDVQQLSISKTGVGGRRRRRAGGLAARVRRARRKHRGGTRSRRRDHRRSRRAGFGPARLRERIGDTERLCGGRSVVARFAHHRQLLG